MASVSAQALASDAPSTRVVSQKDPRCIKTYIVEPSGQKIESNVFDTELPAAKLKSILKDEADRYGGWNYDPIGKLPTRKQNCAGLVMQSLFPGVMKQAKVDPSGFVNRIVMPYGKKVSYLLAKKGDVVVYRQADGKVKHVAVVESVPLIGPLRIRTKDGDERPYIGDLPRPAGAFALRNDPLIKSHADPGGRVEIWRLDRSRVRIREVSSGKCDETTPGSKPKPKPAAGAFPGGTATELTFTIEGVTVTTDLKTKKQTPADPVLKAKSGSVLDGSASLNGTLPKGWSVVVFHLTAEDILLNTASGGAFQGVKPISPTFDAFTRPGVYICSTKAPPLCAPVAQANISIDWDP